MQAKTCYFFGTFNPIHVGHLLMANQAVALLGNALGFNSVTFVPAGNPPHRQGELGLLPAKQRFNLIEQAIYGQPSLRVSPIETIMAEEGLITYTVDVLKRLDAFSSDGRCLMLMGQDAYESISTWYKADVLFEKCAFIVLQRPSDICLAQKSPLIQMEAGVVYPLSIPPIGISATYIRQRSLSERSQPNLLYRQLMGLMPERALSYFIDNRLYEAV